jgi:uncharacterized protein
MPAHHFRTADIPPEAFAPDADRVLHGTPQGKVHNGYESPDGNRLAGEWSCGAGAWRVSYSEWEYCRILEGRVRLTDDNGSIIEAGPGDNLVIEPGYAGVWENLEPVRKIYVVDLAAGIVAKPV